jgi:hypothetical protein
MPRRHLQLDRDEQARLVRLRDRDPRPYVRERAAALLKIADGMAPYAVAMQGLSQKRKPDTVYDWLNRYEDDGFDGLFQQSRRSGGFPPSGG